MTTIENHLEQLAEDAGDLQEALTAIMDNFKSIRMERDKAAKKARSSREKILGGYPAGSETARKAANDTPEYNYWSGQVHAYDMALALLEAGDG